MTDGFDPYHELLGIPPNEQPPNYYRLLGVRMFEDNEEVISNAADRQMYFVRKSTGGPYVKLTQRLLNELAEAKLCLLNPTRKASYDKRLQGGSGEAAAAPPVEPAAPSSPPVPAAAPKQEEPPQPEPSSPAEPRRQRRRPAMGEALPPPPPDTGPSEWIIGSSPKKCDLVVDRPYVSSRHCKLIRTPEGFMLEDLSSTNGTFVNRRRIREAVPVTQRDMITLGKTTPMPWPPETTAAQPGTEIVVHIGRAAGNDLVLDDDRVSAHHARLTINARETIIEDLGSTNGTAVGTLDRKVKRCPVLADETIYFGGVPVPLKNLVDKFGKGALADDD